MKIKSLSNFNFSSASSSGGKTGSMRVTDNDNNFFQYKKSIVKKSWLDRKLAGQLDTANLGEFLVSCIATKLGAAPNIYLVPDPKQKTVDIVSAYLVCPPGGRLQSLDDFLGGAKIGSHTSLVCEKTDVSKQQYNLEDINKRYPGFKKELANAIAMSALVGDHDINPGNMIVIIDAENRVKIVRIDYGHACDNLCKHPKFGGKVTHQNPIIDYFNRTSLDHVPLLKKGEHKLWRDYPAIVSTTEMAEALTELARTNDFSDKIEQGLLEARETIIHLLNNNPQISPNLIINTYQNMAERVLREPLPIKDNQTIEEKLDIIFKSFQQYYQNNQLNMNYAAQVLSLQLKIKDAVNSDNHQQIDELRLQYQDLVMSCPLGKFSWIKENKNTPTFNGNFEQYLIEQINTKQFNEKSTSRVHHYFSMEDHQTLSQIDPRIKEKISQISIVYQDEIKKIFSEQPMINFREKFLFFLPQKNISQSARGATITVNDFLGSEGLKLYHQALLEELNSQEYLDKLTIALSDEKNKQIPCSLESLSKVRGLVEQIAQEQGYSGLMDTHLLDSAAVQHTAMQVKALLLENQDLVLDNQNRIKNQFKEIVSASNHVRSDDALVANHHLQELK